jgi:SAM-dependent methyltransferase
VEAFDERHRPVPEVHVLELGAAEGLALAEIRRLLGRPGESLGVEASEELVRRAVPMVDLIVGDATGLPARVPVNHFHLCAALAVLEHLSHPELAVAEAFRRLKAGGVFVASCPHPGWEAISSRLGLLQDETHQQHLSIAALADMVRTAGFVRVEQRRFMLAPVAFLPYLGIPIAVQTAARIDAWIRRKKWLDFAFVNQAVVGSKPEV